ncbi:ImmA/IrrE family metallo-endopeptidase [Aminivibrio sp.]|jgi:Zn-dependent peptidase ImmA (M78 family)|uniref:ImmA/IrrE family metallo-endopeptidase n=1 Tax=Aminivibrio sp. TaxID=1872489 RepID=UPI00345E98F8
MMAASDSSSGNRGGFVFPAPPEYIPEWAEREANSWTGLDEFEILVRAEEITGKRIEITCSLLPESTWGFHIVKGHRAGIFLNRRLPDQWKRFALFHELYHLLEHRKGESFWRRTATPLSSFEHQADLFAWAVALKEWEICWKESSL